MDFFVVYFYYFFFDASFGKIAALHDTLYSVSDLNCCPRALYCQKCCVVASSSLWIPLLDSFWHNGLIAKLAQIGVTGKPLDLFKSYLSNRKQRVVIDGVYSDPCDVKAGVPQGSRLGPLLFIIYINDILENLECNAMLFADDTSLTAFGVDPSLTAAALNRDLLKIANWAEIWKVTFNATKSKDIIFTNRVLNNSPPLTLNNTVVDRVSTHKHLGLYLTSTLDWSRQVQEVCTKAYRKLAVLRSVKHLHRNTLDLLYKLTVRSVVDYGIIVYGSTLKASDLARLEQLQYRAGKLITGALHLTSSEKINNDLGWESIKIRADFLGLSLFHKIVFHETRPLVRSCLSEKIFRKGSRQFGNFSKYPNYGAKFSKSYFPYFSNKWNNLPRSTRNLDLTDFKDKLKSVLKPLKLKHHAYGSKLGNKLWTRLRLNRTHLNSHGYATGKVATPACQCHHKNETVQHYLLDCFLYTNERQLLFSKVNQYVSNFYAKSKTHKTELLLFGIPNNDNSEINSNVAKLTQSFILQTKRFLIRQ